jgi:hypothetical protein
MRDRYQAQEEIFAKSIADRTDWERATEHTRHLAMPAIEIPDPLQPAISQPWPWAQRATAPAQPAEPFVPASWRGRHWLARLTRPARPGSPA